MDGQPGPGWRKQPIRPLSVRFDEALVLASSLHRDQVRKASGVPYVSHLLAVASLVLDEGGSEDMAIAALLHDAAEDQGGGIEGKRLSLFPGERLSSKALAELPVSGA